MKKYGIRYYPDVGGYIAFIDTTLFAIQIDRKYIDREGNTGNRELMKFYMETSEPNALMNIKLHSLSIKVKDMEYEDKYVTVN